jgi:hypothetical protein
LIFRNGSSTFSKKASDAKYTLPASGLIKSFPLKHKPLPKQRACKLVHGIFIIRIAGSELRFHGIFIIRIAGSEILFKTEYYSRV